MAEAKHVARKIALVTGANKGIGLAIVERLLGLSPLCTLFCCCLLFVVVCLLVLFAFTHTNTNTNNSIERQTVVLAGWFARVVGVA